MLNQTEARTYKSTNAIEMTIKVMCLTTLCANKWSLKGKVWPSVVIIDDYLFLR